MRRCHPCAWGGMTWHHDEPANAPTPAHGSKANNQSQTTTSTLATSLSATTMSSQSAATTLMTCLETCMLTEAELAAALRISAIFTPR